MPTFNDPIADADELREAARGLAHATRSLTDPTEIYPQLGALSSSLASMAQSLHQLGDFHDRQATKTALVKNDAYHGRAASYRVSGNSTALPRCSTKSESASIALTRSRR